jgi:hypothetical protein
MLTFRRNFLALAAGQLVVLLASAYAQATPITVNLRVEGSTTTLYEGPVATEAILDPPGITTASSTTAEPCDVKDNGANGGFGTAAGTPTTALYEAATASGLAFDAEWSKSLNDFEISQVGGDIADASGNEEYWGYAVNYTTAGVGGCQFQLAPGSEVLWAYNYFNLSHLLSLTGPTNANVGGPITLHVVDGQTGTPIAGAAIGEDNSGITTTIPGSSPTNAEGNATITLAHSGILKLKATQPESVRSNAISVCVHNGNDCTCGTTTPIVACPTDASGCQGGITKALPPPPPPPDVAHAGGVLNAHRYSRRSAPRLLSGTVEVQDGGTLREVRISLQRRFHNRCFDFSGTRERFVSDPKCRPSFFSAGSSESFSYLLPARLSRGSYTYEIEAVNTAGLTTKLSPGVSRVVFSVK